MQKVQHGYEDNNDTTWHSKDYEGLEIVRLTSTLLQVNCHVIALKMACTN